MIDKYGDMRHTGWDQIGLKDDDRRIPPHIIGIAP
jgi:hypothetical protein